MILIGRFLIAIARRNHHPFDAQGHHLIEEVAVAHGIGAVEKRRIRRDAKAAPDRRLDRAHRHIVDAFAANGVIVLLARPVHVHREAQILARA